MCDIGEGDARIEIRDDDSTIETRVDGEVEKKGEDTSVVMFKREKKRAWTRQVDAPSS